MADRAATVAPVATVGCAAARGADSITHLDVVTRDTAALAAAVAADPGAAVACYDGWDLAELARHVGKIQRWVTDVLRTRATERPPWPDVGTPSASELPQWLTSGAAELTRALAAVAPEEPVWTFGPPGSSTCAFWRRRMALESAVHRWDAEDALGRDPVIAADLALEGVDEALHVYLEPRLEGRDVGGEGQRVALVPDGTEGWTMVLRADAVEVTVGRDGADAVVSGPAADVWLLLMCRRSLDELEVSGDLRAAELVARAVTLVPGPAG